MVSPIKILRPCGGDSENYSVATDANGRYICARAEVIDQVVFETTGKRKGLRQVQCYAINYTSEAPPLNYPGGGVGAVTDDNGIARFDSIRIHEISACAEAPGNINLLAVWSIAPAGRDTQSFGGVDDANGPADCDEPCPGEEEPPPVFGNGHDKGAFTSADKKNKATLNIPLFWNVDRPTDFGGALAVYNVAISLQIQKIDLDPFASKEPPPLPIALWLSRNSPRVTLHCESTRPKMYLLTFRPSPLVQYICPQQEWVPGTDDKIKLYPNPANDYTNPATGQRDGHPLYVTVELA